LRIHGNMRAGPEDYPSRRREGSTLGAGDRLAPLCLMYRWMGVEAMSVHKKGARWT
jgi:hypothetical protein